MLPFVLGSLLSRVGGAMFGVSVIVMVSARQGSYAVAAAVSAVGLIVLAAAGPILGRFIDKYGQRRVGLPFTLTSVVAGLSMAACSLAGAPTWTLFATYGLSAIIPELGPMTRARWAYIFRDHPRNLHTALSYEQVADEFGYVLGPVLAVLPSTLWLPEAGLILATVLYAVGGLIVLSNRRTEPPVVPHDERPHGLALHRPGLWLLTLTLVMTGVIFGANEVIAVAVADRAGEKQFSSVILALFAVGSMTSGLIYGTRTFRSSLTRRMAITAGLMVLLEAPALAAPSLPVLAVVMLVAGSATAPLLITAMALVQRILPFALVTEGIAVAVTGVLVGISLGTVLAGWAVEAFGAQPAYVMPIAAGLVAVAIIGAGNTRLSGAERSAVPSEAAGPDPVAPSTPR